MATQASPMVTRKSVTGFVTKLVGDGATYGFINDEIFFQQANVADGPAGNGDRVFAECEYSEHLPIKWNATSIKIIGRAGQQQAPPSSILESDPRRQSRQAAGLITQQPAQAQPPTSLAQPQLMQQQQQQPPISVANTYPQHRQQRQQQQQQPHDTDFGSLQPPAPQNHMQQPPPPPISIGLMDQGGLSQPPPDFFNPFAQPPVQHQPEIQPFQHDTPMGPPKLEYTSQLGSAFVQNQFMPGPLLPQQPPTQPLLPQIQPQPQQQQQQQPQLHQPQHQNQNMRQQHQSNQRDQRGLRDNNNKMGNTARFHDRNDKNDRNQSNRNVRGRNENSNNKFEQSRSGERDSPSNSRSSRSSRDRSTSRNDPGRGRYDDSSSRSNRQSPARNSMKSASVVSSDRGHKSSRRSYDSQNIPRGQILTDLNPCNMRARCSSSVHVPSDLKSVKVNKFLRLDIKNTPKPLLYEIDDPTPAEEAKHTDKDQASDVTKPTPGNEPTDNNLQSSAENKTTEKISDNHSTPPSSKSDMKLNNKYGVKVVLISLPETQTIYKKVFGADLDAYSNESKSHPRLDEVITLLCNKATNGGHSLIGGKFDPVIDGFIEGEINEFERNGRQPDLIATCKRVVKEQTGLDLGGCQSWSLVSTFLYNNKSDYFSSKASIEYSFIYLPHIWTVLPDELDESFLEKESLQVNVSTPNQSIDTASIGSCDVTMTGEGDEPIDQATNEPAAVIDESIEKPVIDGAANDTSDIGPADAQPAKDVTLGNISDLKVADLKQELDKRNIKYKPNMKKAELALALQESLVAQLGEETSAESQDQKEDTPQEDKQPDKQLTSEPTVPAGIVQDQLEEGEVVADDDTNTEETSAGPDIAELDTVVEARSSTKRKECDDVADGGEQEAKKICNKDEPASSDEKVSLIKEPFKVRARPGQFLSNVSLYDAVQVSKHDQFELSVTSFVLKESLVQHLSEYIFTVLVEDSRQRSKDSSDSASTTSSIATSQDTSISDTNNNNNTLNKSSADNQSSMTDKSSTFSKEYPVDRYITLAFSYFDSTHMGYVLPDDLFKLFNNTGLTISKRALWSLIGESDKFNYRTLPELPPRFPPTYVYRFPEQFSCLPGTSTSSGEDGDSKVSTSAKMIEYQGVRYDVDKLIQQVRDAETTRVNMVERFNHAIESSDKQAEEIHVLEVSRVSLSKSILSLNNELSELKRDKEAIEKQCEALRLGIKGAMGSLNDLVSVTKDEK